MWDIAPFCGIRIPLWDSTKIDATKTASPSRIGGLGLENCQMIPSWEEILVTARNLKLIIEGFSGQKAAEVLCE